MKKGLWTITELPLEGRAAPEAPAEVRGAGHAGRGIGTLCEQPEKPNGALDFLKHHLGAATPEKPEIELLRLEFAEMKEKYEAIEEENKKLKAKFAQYEPPQEEKHAE